MAIGPPSASLIAFRVRPFDTSLDRAIWAMPVGAAELVGEVESISGDWW